QSRRFHQRPSLYHPRVEMVAANLFPEIASWQSPCGENVIDVAIDHRDNGGCGQSRLVFTNQFDRELHQGDRTERRSIRLRPAPRIGVRVSINEKLRLAQITR